MTGAAPDQLVVGGPAAMGVPLVVAAWRLRAQPLEQGRV